MTGNLEQMDLPAVIEQYADAAARHGRASEEGRPDVANAAHDDLTSAYRELKRRGPEAQRELQPLLAHPDAFVRAWVGAHALEFAPHEGEAVLRELSDHDPSLAGFDAKITLDEWRAGRLRFP